MEDTSFEDYAVEPKNKRSVKLLAEMNDKLARIIELLEKQGTIRPG